MELTEDQKFMICESAGVDMVVTRHANGSWHKKTKNKCAVVWDGNQFKVYVGPQ